MAETRKTTHAERVEATRVVHQRLVVIQQLLEMEGVPADALTFHACIMLGVENISDQYGKETCALMLEQYAASVRRNERIPK